MEKKWFSITVDYTGAVTSYLNKLAKNNVKPEEIKMVIVMPGGYYIIWYYADKEIE